MSQVGQPEIIPCCQVKCSTGLTLVPGTAFEYVQYARLILYKLGQHAFVTLPAKVHNLAQVAHVLIMTSDITNIETSIRLGGNLYPHTLSTNPMA